MHHKKRNSLIRTRIFLLFVDFGNLQYTTVPAKERKHRRKKQTFDRTNWSRKNISRLIIEEFLDTFQFSAAILSHSCVFFSAGTFYSDSIPTIFTFLLLFHSSLSFLGALCLCVCVFFWTFCIHLLVTSLMTVILFQKVNKLLLTKPGNSLVESWVKFSEFGQNREKEMPKYKNSKEERKEHEGRE